MSSMSKVHKERMIPSGTSSKEQYMCFISRTVLRRGVRYGNKKGRLSSSLFLLHEGTSW